MEEKKGFSNLRRFVINSMDLILGYRRPNEEGWVEIDGIFDKLRDAHWNYGISGERQEVWAEVGRMEEEGLLEAKETGVNFFMRKTQKLVALLN